MHTSVIPNRMLPSKTSVLTSNEDCSPHIFITSNFRQDIACVLWFNAAVTKSLCFGAKWAADMDRMA